VRIAQVHRLNNEQLNIIESERRFLKQIKEGKQKGMMLDLSLDLYTALIRLLSDKEAFGMQVLGIYKPALNSPGFSLLITNKFIIFH
jgi:hypothetical protein